MNALHSGKSVFPGLLEPVSSGKAGSPARPRPRSSARRKLVFAFARRKQGRWVGVVSWLIYLLGVFPSHLYALPSGGSVQAGAATIETVSPEKMVIQQASDKAIIHWDSFGNQVNEHIHFQLPSADSASLNRVTGNDPSHILGKLSSNGNLMLINPNGILFGRDAQIDVNGLIATTTDIRNEDFLAGQFRFDLPSSTGAGVVNRGRITASEGGLVALVAPWVENSGVINARLGSVSLASGSTFTLDLYGDRLVQLGVGQEFASGLTGLDGEPVSALVNHSGAIHADGGIVRLDVSTARHALDNVINLSGIVQARTAVEQNGKIVLMGGDTGQVNVSGTLDASGTGAGETGGSVHVFGENLNLFGSALLDVSGDSGGGDVLVGGDYQGGGPYFTATDASVGQGVSVFADALNTGDGGRVIFWANRRMQFLGRVQAQGGRQRGNGGFVEVSGKEELYFDGSVDTRAANGNTGTLLLDPEHIIIADGAGTSASGAATFTIHEKTLEALAGFNNVNLTANKSITLNDLSDDVLSLNISGSVTLFAGNGDITFKDTADKITTNGSLDITANGNLSLGSLDSNDHNIRLSGRDLNLQGTIDSGTGTTTLTSSTGGTIGLGDAAGSMSVSGAELQRITAAGLTVGNGASSITVDNVSAADSSGIGTLTLNATGSGSSITFANSASTFDALTANAGNGISVDANIATDGGGLILNGNADGSGSSSIVLASGVAVNSAGNLELRSAGGGITSSGNATLTSGGRLTLGSDFTSTGDAALNSSTGITLASGIAVTSGGVLTMSTTTGGVTAQGAVGLNSANGLQLNDDLTAQGAVAIDADTDGDGGAFTLAGGKTVTTNDNALSITAGDIVLNGSIVSGTGTTTLASSTGGTIGLGDAAGTLLLSDAELQRITANGLTVGDGTSSITVDNVSATDSSGIGTLTLNATGSGSSITFANNASTFDALTANAGNGITVAANVTTDSGGLILNGNADGSGSSGIDLAGGVAVNAAGNLELRSAGGGITSSGNASLTSGAELTFGNDFSSDGNAILNGGTGITLASGIAVTSGGALTMSATTGGVTAQGAVALNSADGLQLNDDLTAQGAVAIDADTDGDGGAFTLAGGKTVNTNDNALSITAGDIVLNGSLTSGAAATSLASSTGGTIGLGDAAGTLSLSGAELQRIAANQLIVGDATNGDITVDNVLAADGSGIGTLTLNATKSGSSVSFANNASAFNALNVNAGNGVNVSADVTAQGAVALNTDADGNGSGSFTLDSSKNLSTSDNALSITTAGLSVDGNLSSGSADTTIEVSQAGASIGVGDSADCGGSCDLQLRSGDLNNITAGSFTLGGANNGGITVDGLTAAVPLTLVSSAAGKKVAFANNPSSFTELTVLSGGTISDAADGTLNTSGVASFTAANGVSFTNTANVFGGPVNLATTSGNATLFTNSALTLGTSSVGGTLTATVGGGNGLTVNGTQTASGGLSLTADSGLNLTGRLVSTSASASAIQLTSGNGGVFDGDSDGGLDIDAPGGGLVVKSVTGFGTASNPIETRIASVNITNSGDGEINLFETDSLNIASIQHAGTGDVKVSYFGALTGEANVSAADGSKTFINRDFGNVAVGGSGKTLSQLSTETTASRFQTLEGEYAGPSLPVNRVRSVGEALSDSGAGPFVANLFEKDFKLFEVAGKKSEYEGLGGFARFWGPLEGGQVEVAKTRTRKRLREQASVQEDSDSNRNSRAATRLPQKRASDNTVLTGENRP